MKIFKSFYGTTYEEWEEFYFNLGKQRLFKINELPIRNQFLLQTFHLTPKKSNEVRLLSNEEKQLNSYYGRTKSELEKIGGFMYEELCKQGNPLSITKEECILYVFIRVLDEIFIGKEREDNTVKKLKEFFPKAEIRELSAEDDSKYAVDFEIYIENQLKLAIQIKSGHYLRDNQPILVQTKSINQKKNKAYTDIYGVDVLTVYSSETGYIFDKNTFSIIRSYLD